MMNNIKTIAIFVSLSLATVITLCVMIYSLMLIAFPKDETIESNWEYIKYHNVQRAKAIKAAQIESMCKDPGFTMSEADCE